jgi:hypothetical protein
VHLEDAKGYACSREYAAVKAAEQYGEMPGNDWGLSPIDGPEGRGNLFDVP